MKRWEINPFDRAFLLPQAKSRIKMSVAENLVCKMENGSMKKGMNEYHLPEREVDILYVMWNAGRPLMASEITEADEELKLATVHTTLKRMLKKNLIEVVDFAKSGNVFGRCYQPTISIREFELGKISSEFKNIQCKDITASNLVAALLDEEDSGALEEELDELERIIQERRKEISKGG